MRYLSLFFLFVLGFSCVPPDSRNKLEIKTDLGDIAHRAVIDAGDRRDSISILEALNSEDIDIRYLALRAIGKKGNDYALERLAEILISDPSDQLRSLAAFALGQSANPRAEQLLIKGFAAQDTLLLNSRVRALILEAVGKTGSSESLENIASVGSYQNTDDQLLWGQAAAIYRFGLRGIFSDKASALMAGFVQSKDISPVARLYAANYFYRFGQTPFPGGMDGLLETVRAEVDPTARLALAGALGKRLEQDSLGKLFTLIYDEKDYRTKLNIIKGFGSMDIGNVKDSLYRLLSDRNVHVRSTAADVIDQTSTVLNHDEVLSLARSQTDELVRAKLFGVALKSIPPYFVNTRNLLVGEIDTLIASSGSKFVMTALINSLMYDPLAYPLVKKWGLTSKDAFVKTNTITGVRRLLQSEKFRQTFRSEISQEVFKRALLDDLLEILDTNDSGHIAALCSLLSSESLGFKPLIDLQSPFRNALLRLKSPQDLETIYSIENLLAYLNDTVYVTPVANFAHPIDWTRLENISDSSRAFINTTKGQMEIELFVSRAPGTVANFIELVDADYYDGLSFHRVVPAFVIQGGCPRGDGYGGPDYAIRSELTEAYFDEEGYLGMASAGQDTEGAQWFITHCPTPHLDGKYTIFGKVKSGMDVVHSIEQGDIIQDIRILK